MTKDDPPDPVIPFRVSYATTIASNSAAIKTLLALNATEMTLLVLTLTILLMKGGG